MNAKSLCAIALCLAGGQAIQCSNESAHGPEGHLALEVAPLALTGISDATYTVTVKNGLGAMLWSRSLTSSRFGNGLGAVSYVGTCDAEQPQTTVSLTLDELRDATHALVAGVDYTNPAPSTNPIVLTRTCVANVDVPVVFDLTIARAANQGFFDVAITFDDIFCSAKLDCGPLDAPLMLLHDARGERAETAVVGFACTAGPGADTTLCMDRLVITCDNGGPFIVDVADGPGNLDPLFDDPTSDLLYQAAVYRGTDPGDDGWDIAYWNIALGLNTGAFVNLGACTLTGTATASDGPFVNGATPEGQRWPLVTWSVPLTNGAGVRVCTEHGLDQGNGVRTSYSPTEGHGFYASFTRATGLVTVTGAVPDQTTLLSCTDSIIASGEHTTCRLEPRLLGAAIQTAAGNFNLASIPGGVLSALAPSYGNLFTFTFTGQVSAIVTLDAGVASTVVTVTATPDATSALTCPAHVAVGATARCTIDARRGGVAIQARAGAFSPTTTAGTLSAITPSVGSILQLDFTAPPSSGLVTIDVGPTSAAVQITDTADATGTLSCVASTLAIGATTTCTSTARREGASVTALAAQYTPSASAGSVSAMSPEVGTGFTFTFTAPLVSGSVVVGDGLRTTTLTIVDVVDATSTLACDDSELAVDATTTCTITPKKGGATVTTQAGNFTPSATVGSVSAAAPTTGDAFTFTFRAPAGSGPALVRDGFNEVAITVLDTPDGTSTLTCADPVLMVGIPTICTIMPRRAGQPITTRATAFTANVTAGSVGPIGPAFGTTFTFMVTAPATSGPITVADGFGNFSITVTDTPDSTSTLTCAAVVVDVGGQTICTITANRSGASITARASAFTPLASAGAVSEHAPDLGTAFTFVLTAPQTSGPVTVSDGFNSVGLTITATPDATSTLSCADGVLNVGIPTICTITPMRAGASITALAAAFSAQASAGTVSSISPSTGTTFTFTFTAPATTGPVTVQDGFQSFAVTVVDAPDSTSTLACAATQLAVGASASCLVTPKKNGVNIYARANTFAANASAGSVSSISPTVGNSLTFIYTAPATTGAVTVQDGFHSAAITIYDTPDATSTLSCTDAVLMVGIPTICTITAKRANLAITALASAFAPAVGSGAVSTISPSSGTALTFTYTAGVTTGPVTVQDGLHSFAITVVDAPDASTTFSCTSSTRQVGTTMTCTITPKKAGAVIYTRASAFDPSATGGGSISGFGPTVGNGFTFTYTAPATSGASSVSDGTRTFAVSVYDLPDTTTTMTCASATQLVSTGQTCTITPKKGGAPITALASAFTLSASAGSASAIAPASGTSLTFTYTASAASGAVTINNGLGAVGVTVYN